MPPGRWLGLGRNLCVSNNRRVFNICYRFTGNRTEAEDLTQDVFLRNLQDFGELPLSTRRLRHLDDKRDAQSLD